MKHCSLGRTQKSVRSWHPALFDLLRALSRCRGHRPSAKIRRLTLQCPAANCYKKIKNLKGGGSALDALDITEALCGLTHFLVTSRQAAQIKKGWKRPKCRVTLLDHCSLLPIIKR